MTYDNWLHHIDAAAGQVLQTKAGMQRTFRPASGLPEQNKVILLKEEMNKHEARYPLGIGEPEDVANAIAFFLSDESKWITGTSLKMDGGLTLGF